MNQPRVAVEVEDHRLVHREEAVEFALGRAMRMFAGGLHPEEIDDVHEAQPEFGQPLTQDGGGRERFLGRDVAAWKKFSL